MIYDENDVIRLLVVLCQDLAQNKMRVGCIMNLNS